MEGGWVLSPPPWEKRRAWARQSRCWTPRRDEEAAPPNLQPPLEGSPSSKIETWLQECGSAVGLPPEEPGFPFGGGSAGTSFEDDLTLGAEALMLPGSDRTRGRALRDRPLGHSMASSLSTRTSSSISEVLERLQPDAEQLLSELGFGGEEGGAGGRVPPRFFAAPSLARGIDFQLFLKAQVRRLETEEPCLLLASRFQQVQALAVTADAFFCLYSYVSRTPLQRIAPQHPPWAGPHLPTLPLSPPVPLSPPQPCPLSPVERLRKVVSTLCLYSPPPKGPPPAPPGDPPVSPVLWGRGWGSSSGGDSGHGEGMGRTWGAWEGMGGTLGAGEGLGGTLGSGEGMGGTWGAGEGMGGT